MKINFVWEKGCLNDNAIKELKKRGIRFQYIMMKLHAFDGKKWVPIYFEPVQYKPIEIWEMSF